MPEIAAFLRCVPELRAMVGEGPAAEFAAVVASSGDGATAKAALQALFTAVMKCGDAATHAEALGARLSAEADAAALEPPHDIALRLTKECVAVGGGGAASCAARPRHVDADAVRRLVL